MGDLRAALPVLTYHSISSEGGPTSIPVETFAMQMRVLAQSGYLSMTIQEFMDWRDGVLPDPERRVLITFDDGFADFDEAAFPILKSHGFSAVVFLPTAKLGGHEAWNGANSPPRPLMSWERVRALAEAGVEFGSHARTHPDLTRIPPDQRRDEIARSAVELAQHLGGAPRSFAAPYGHVDRAVLAEVAQTYDVAFGVRLDRARRDDNRFDVPRIEMHYFREEKVWADFLDGQDAYFHGRRALRSVRVAAHKILSVGGARD